MGRILTALALLAAMATAWGCARRAEEVIVVPTCDCEEPCPDCVCEKEGAVGAASPTAEAPASDDETGP
jgi:hypothetical protein